MVNYKHTWFVPSINVEHVENVTVFIGCIMNLHYYTVSINNSLIACQIYLDLFPG